MCLPSLMNCSGARSTDVVILDHTSQQPEEINIDVPPHILSGCLS